MSGTQAHAAGIRMAAVRARYSDFGGAEQAMQRMLETLPGAGVAVTLIAREWRSNDAAAKLLVNPFYLGRMWRDWSFARAVCGKLREQKFDLVQSNERIACCQVYRAGDGVHREWLRQRGRALSPWRAAAQYWLPYHRYVMGAEQALFLSPLLRAVICNSHMVRDEIIEWFGLAPEKLEVIYSGVDSERFHPRLRPQHRAALRREHQVRDAERVWLFVGSGFERKGLTAALRAMATLPNGRLWVVGKDKKLARFQTLAQRLNLAQRVQFFGAVRDVTPFYGAADALVLPTLYDPFPNVALEAMASGLPLLTSSKSGAAELIEAGRNGFVCDALDITAQAQHMRALQDADLEAMGAAARVTVEPFTLQRMAQQYVALYQRVLTQSGASPAHA